MLDKFTIEMGALLAGVAALFTLCFEIRKSRKTTFINTVTMARKAYMDELRKLVAEFCAIAKANNKNEYKLNELSFQLKMMMNPAGFINWWDDEAITLIDEIVEHKQEDDIKQFVALMQSWLALEWHGMANEGKFGVLNDHQKDALRKKFYLEYKKYVNIKKI
jgi:hypothetical protein